MDEGSTEKDVKFETISAEKIPFGRNNFIEVARKKAITKEGENEFISLSRGFFLPDGTEKFKKSITIPDDQLIKDFVIGRSNRCDRVTNGTGPPVLIFLFYLDNSISR